MMRQLEAMKGKGGFTMTGQIGDVMRESAQASLSYVRANVAELAMMASLGPSATGSSTANSAQRLAPAPGPQFHMSPIPFP